MRHGSGWWCGLGAVLAGLLLVGCGGGGEAAPQLGRTTQGIEFLDPQWTRTLAAPAGDVVGVESDENGNVVIAFQYTGPARISGRALPWNGTSNLHLGVARYASDGTLLWARGFAPAAGGTVQPTALDVSPAGNVFVGGRFSGSLTLGGRMFTGTRRNFVVKLSAGGVHRWSRATSPSAGTDFDFRDFAADSEGNLVALAAQRVTGTPDVHNRIFLIGYRGTDGEPFWSGLYTRAGASGNVEPSAIALDGLNRIYVAGTFVGAVSLGALLPSSDEPAAFVAAFGSRGASRWARQVLRSGVAVDVAAGGSSVVASVQNNGGEGFVFGGVSRAAGVYVVAYGTDGAERWLRRTAGPELGPAVRLGMTPGRNEVVLYGAGSADALGSPRFPSGADRWHVALLRRFTGEPLRLTRFPNPPGGPDHTFHQRGVTLTPGGNVYCTGRALGEQADFGLGPIPAGREVFLLKLSP